MLSLCSCGYGYEERGNVVNWERGMKTYEFREIIRFALWNGLTVTIYLSIFMGFMAWLQHEYNQGEINKIPSLISTVEYQELKIRLLEEKLNTVTPFCFILRPSQ